MALPTRIFLVLSMCLVVLWGWTSTRHARSLEFRTDAAYRLLHASERRGALQGRVEIGGLDEIPEGALFLRIRAVDTEGKIAMEVSAPVEADGTFEGFGLPIGTADLTMELGVGEVVWEARGVAVDSLGSEDPRIDPIDLSGLVSPVELHVLGPDDRPVESGRVAWRRSAGSTEDVTFGSVVPVRDGRVMLLSAEEVVDVVALVPGARPEIFEGVADGSELMLGPGSVASVTVTGPRPDPEKWILHVLLHPVELDPTFEVLGAAAPTVGGTLSGQLDAEGHAEVPITFPGTYDLRWFAEEARRGVSRTVKVAGDHPPVHVEPGDGWVDVAVEFPLDDFVRGLDR